LPSSAKQNRDEWILSLNLGKRLCIKRDPAKPLGSAVARSTPAFGQLLENVTTIV
jgi:hypothetical protein